MKAKSFLVSTSSSQCSSQSSLQPEAARVRTDLSLFLSIIPTRNKEKDPEFFCYRLIIFDLKTKNGVSVFSRNEREKPTKQSSNLQVLNSFLEGSAVIDKGDYLFFRASFISSKVSCGSYIPILTKRKKCSYTQQYHKAGDKSSSYYAVINFHGDYGKMESRECRRCQLSGGVGMCNRHLPKVASLSTYCNIIGVHCSQ